MGPTTARWKRQLVWILFSRKCHYCKRPINFDSCQIDHRLPVSRGGKWNEENLVLCCEDCNILKRNLTEDEFLNGFSPKNIELIKREIRFPIAYQPTIQEKQIIQEAFRKRFSYITHCKSCGNEKRLEYDDPFQK